MLSSHNHRLNHLIIQHWIILQNFIKLIVNFFNQNWLCTNPATNNYFRAIDYCLNIEDHDCYIAAIAFKNG